jgi:hypothetical protein
VVDFWNEPDVSAIQQILMHGSGSAPATYLDGLATTPRMAVSMKKKLISTATNALRVRRSSDSTEQDIGFSGTTLDSASMASFVGANSGFLRTLYDQTGNSEDAGQSTAGNQPRLVNSGTPDAMATWDGSSDSLSITSLATGAAQLGIYLKFKMPGTAGVRIIFEQSTNYNNNAQSCVVFMDSTASGTILVASRNAVGAFTRVQSFPASAATTLQLSILIDRTATGTDEIKAFSSGTQLTPTVVGTAVDQTGVFSAYDVYLGARAGTSLYADMGLESLVTYNADTSAIRTAIEAIIA